MEGLRVVERVDRCVKDGGLWLGHGLAAGDEWDVVDEGHRVFGAVYKGWCGDVV